MDEPYALYLGKLAPNKGTDYCSTSSIAAGSRLAARRRRRRPRSRRAGTPAAAGAVCGFSGWLDKAERRGWLAHASMLIFPSRGPESLSRVLIEASALGIPIAAMDTGGTRDIVEHGVTGLLSSTPEGWLTMCAGCEQDAALRRTAG